MKTPTNLVSETITRLLELNNAALQGHESSELGGYKVTDMPILPKARILIHDSPPSSSSSPPLRKELKSEDVNLRERAPKYEETSLKRASDHYIKISIENSFTTWRRSITREKRGKATRRSNKEKASMDELRAQRGSGGAPMQGVGDDPDGGGGDDYVSGTKSIYNRVWFQIICLVCGVLLVAAVCYTLNTLSEQAAEVARLEAGLPPPPPPPSNTPMFYLMAILFSSALYISPAFREGAVALALVTAKGLSQYILNQLIGQGGGSTETPIQDQDRVQDQEIPQIHRLVSPLNTLDLNNDGWKGSPAPVGAPLSPSQLATARSAPSISPSPPPRRVGDGHVGDRVISPSLEGESLSPDGHGPFEESPTRRNTGITGTDGHGTFEEERAGVGNIIDRLKATYSPAYEGSSRGLSRDPARLEEEARREMVARRAKALLRKKNPSSSPNPLYNPSDEDHLSTTTILATDHQSEYNQEEVRVSKEGPPRVLSSMGGGAAAVHDEVQEIIRRAKTALNETSSTEKDTGGAPRGVGDREELFTAIDANGDGIIDRQEFQAAARNSGPGSLTGHDRILNGMLHAAENSRNSGVPAGRRPSISSLFLPHNSSDFIRNTVMEPQHPGSSGLPESENPVWSSLGADPHHRRHEELAAAVSLRERMLAEEPDFSSIVDDMVPLAAALDSKANP